MSLDQCISLFSALIAFGGFVALAVQIHDGNKQQRSQALIQIHGFSRKLLSLAFWHPQLFGVLNDAPNVDADWERRYLQLWVNQFLEVYTYLNEAVVKGELRDSLTYDIAQFFTQKNAQRYWAKNGSYYPESFRAFIDKIIVDAKEQAAAGSHGGSNGLPAVLGS